MLIQNLNPSKFSAESKFSVMEQALWLQQRQGTMWHILVYQPVPCNFTVSLFKLQAFWIANQSKCDLSKRGIGTGWQDQSPYARLSTQLASQFFTEVCISLKSLFILYLHRYLIFWDCRPISYQKFPIALTFPLCQKFLRPAFLVPLFVKKIKWCECIFPQTTFLKCNRLFLSMTFPFFHLSFNCACGCISNGAPISMLDHPSHLRNLKLCKTILALVITRLLACDDFCIFAFWKLWVYFNHFWSNSFSWVKSNNCHWSHLTDLTINSNYYFSASTVNCHFQLQPPLSMSSSNVNSCIHNWLAWLSIFHNLPSLKIYYSRNNPW